MFLFSHVSGVIAIKNKNDKTASFVTTRLSKSLSLLRPPLFSYEEKIALINSIKTTLEGRRRNISKMLMKLLFKPIGEIEKEFEAVFRLLEAARGVIFSRMKKGGKPILAILPFDTPILSIVKVLLFGLLSGRAVVLKPSSFSVGVSKYIFKLLVTLLGKRHIALLTTPGKMLHSAVEPSNFGVVYIGGVAPTITLFSSEYTGRVVSEVSKGTVAVVTSDADIDQVAGETTIHAFSYNGQYCCSQKGLVIPEDIEDVLIDKLREKTERFFIPGSAADGATTATPLVDNSDEWYGYTQISDAVAEGAELIFGGEQPKERTPFKPVIIKNLRADHKLVNEDYRIPYLWIATYQKYPDDFIKGIIKEKRIIVYGKKGTVVGRLKATTGWDVYSRDTISGFFNWEADNPYIWLKDMMPIGEEE